MWCNSTTICQIYEKIRTKTVPFTSPLFNQLHQFIGDKMIERVKKMYEKVWDKKDFCLKLSERVGNKSPRTLQNHWFLSGSIPKQYLSVVLDFLEQTIRKQIEELSNLLNYEA